MSRHTAAAVSIRSEPVAAAAAAWRASVGPRLWPVEEIDITVALGRWCVSDVTSPVHVPPEPVSAMDGIAISAGRLGSVVPRECLFLVDTGDLIPTWCDTVVPNEQCDLLPDGAVRISGILRKGSHIRRVGEDVSRHETVVPAGRVLTAGDVALLRSVGVSSVGVAARPRVAVIPTGDEVVTPAGRPIPGKVFDTNSLMIAQAAHRWGATPTVLPIEPDDPARIADAVHIAARDHDLVVVIAGSSAGRDDYTAHVINELGKVVVHGVAMRPGHPVLLGVLNGATVPVIGLPGNPVAAELTFALFAGPLIAWMSGQSGSEPLRLRAHLADELRSKPGIEEYRAVRLEHGHCHDAPPIAVPLPNGSSKLSTLARIDGWVRIAAADTSLASGTLVRIDLHR